ncbi:MAG TPA: hypothetical protein PKD29_02740, partial [Rhodocyclaceae bacterium]|nr:hypothetical protein [Rhodocyclaceae bacterium]
AREHFGLDVDFRRHHFELARRINAREGAKSVPWETERLTDMLTNYLRWIVEDGKDVGEIEAWIDHERLDHALVPSTQGEPIERPADPGHVTEPQRLALAFWHAIKHGQEEAFAAGPEAIQPILTPAQQRAESADGP